MNFAFGECDENEVDVILTCVHRDNEHNFITFTQDLMPKINIIDCECDADQSLSHSPTSGDQVGLAIYHRR